MTSLLDDESLPNDIAGLEAQIVELDGKMEECREKTKALMAAEDPVNGIFHAEAIHEAKQLHMMLRYQQDLRKARLSQMRMQP